MVDYQPSVTRGGVRSAEIDAGLRAHMNAVYMMMTIAMVVTGAFAYFFGMELKALVNGQQTMILPAELLATMYGTWFRWVIMLAPLGLVFLLGMRVHAMSAPTAQAVFWLYAALVGLSIATIFVRFSIPSIAVTFMATAVAFLALSLYGYTTKTDLSAMGRFLIMGVVGLIIAMIANMFIGSDALSFAISALGVLIFAGLTAYDTQTIKNNYLAMAAHGGPEAQEWMEKSVIMGALTLYLDFLNMFLFLLQFLGASDD